MKPSAFNVILFLFLFAVPPTIFSAETSQVIQGMTLANGVNPETNPYYRKVVETIGKPLLFEKAKILYLIGQVRQSPCEFERNGEIFKGPKAASHLLMKYNAVGGRVETAEQFIQFIASKSSVSGKSYYVLDPRKAKHAMQEVLMNELFLLNQTLRESDLRGIQYRIIHPEQEPPA